jgi:hypothetical protein
MTDATNPTDKAEFYWAIIGDANPEPVAVTMLDGKRVAYTIGCPDPFDLEGGCVELIHDTQEVNLREYDFDAMEYREAPVKPLTIPLKPSERAAEREKAERWLQAEAKKGVRHSWKRLNP